MQAIAIGPIKYVTHDTMPGGSGILRCNVSYILRRQVDHGRASPTIWTGGTGMVRNCDLSGLDISILFSALRRRARRRMFERESIIMEEYCHRLRDTRLHLSVVAFTKFLLLASSLFSPPFSFCSFFLYTDSRNFIINFCYQSSSNSSRATSDVINLKKIINSNFSKTRRAFCLWESSD